MIILKNFAVNKYCFAKCSLLSVLLVNIVWIIQIYDNFREKPSTKDLLVCGVVLKGIKAFSL